MCSVQFLPLKLSDLKQALLRLDSWLVKKQEDIHQIKFSRDDLSVCMIIFIASLYHYHLTLSTSGFFTWASFIITKFFCFSDSSKVQAVCSLVFMQQRNWLDLSWRTDSRIGYHCNGNNNNSHAIFFSSHSQ